MEKEDKIAFSIITLIFCSIAVALMLIVKFVLSSVFGFFATADTTGIGYKDAFLYSIVISVLIMILFAMIGGDGVLGELTVMIAGFFLFVVFFTVSIAWIF